MKRSKKYYKYLDYIRVLALINVLLYHLNILKGGYLAVCVFFVLSGYLSVISAFKTKKFSFKEYYKKILLKIYLPLLIVVFGTVVVISIFPNISWMNLKPETTSVLLGYNNFWQLNANLDYFARHISSPFMHLWYIAILLQFDLIFPFIFIPLRKLGDKVKKILPCILTAILSIAGFIYFCIINLNQNIMITYYSTFTRIFSLLFGVSLGFIHSYYRKNTLKSLKKNKYGRNIVYLYILILMLLFIFVDSKSKYMTISMLLSTLITCRLIDYSVNKNNKYLSKKDTIIKFLSKISYEVYLVQYPIIFLFQFVNINIFVSTLIILILLFTISYILNFTLEFKNKFNILKRITIFLTIIISLYGCYKYIIAKDFSKEMKKLENQLNSNLKIVENRQKEYASKLKNDEEAWKKELDNYEISEDELNEIVSNLPVIGIGDSVMLGAVENLYEKFPKGYFDAKISRTAYVVGPILNDLKSKNILGEPIVFGLGTNGDCSMEQKIELLKICEGKEIFWLTTTNSDSTNANLLTLPEQFPNVHIIDWKSISKGHSEYFYADNIHLTPSGRKAYTEAIYNAIYQVYFKKYENEKEQKIKEHEEELKNKISFYGNDILLNVFNYISEDFKDSKFVVNKEFTYNKIKSELENSINDNSLTKKIVFAFDNSSLLNIEEYENLINLCKDYQIYLLSTNETTNDLSKLKYDNVTIIDFYSKLKENNEYLLSDGIHLSKEGNEELSKILNENLKK